MKLTSKNFLVINGLIFSVITVTLAILYIFMPVYYEEVRVDQVKEAVDKVQQNLDGQDKEEVLKRLTTLDNQDLPFSLYLFEGETVVYPYVDRNNTNSDQPLNDFEITVSSPPVEGEIRSLRQKIVTKDGQEITLEAQYSLQPISDASRVLLAIYPVILVIALVIGTIVAYIYSRSSTKRIKLLSKTSRQMLSLKEGLSCQLEGKDEIAELSRDITSMYQQLRQTVVRLEVEIEKTALSEHSKEEFLRITSHELKTPITSMMGIVDGMLLGVGDFKNRDYYLKECRRILEEQSQLVQDILTISKIDMADFLDTKYWETYAMTRFLEEQLPTYQLLAKMKGYEFDYALSEVTVEANRIYLEKALKNIIDNAFQYTRPEGKIRIQLTEKHLVVENQAQTLLSDSDLSKVFEPFYRPDYSRNRKDGGTGLGLYIVQKILSRHKFNYRLENTDDGWVRFTLDW
ncbi:TPA: HAMP domain-containing histidine kinase [Streptococcus equi subsp. zooepidemicus]|nr:HAMP domain-containing histidine kinase [Streptococcus equi subsp. zooepidemicus]